MKNQLIEHKDKAYMVEEVDGDKLKCKEYVFDLNKEQFVKLNAKTIEDDYTVIPLEIVKIKHSKKVEEPKKKKKGD